MPKETVRIRKGSILVYRCFDIAEEIDLAKAEKILAEVSGRERLKLSRTSRPAIIVRNAPITLTLGETPITIGSDTVMAETSAKIWDYGVLSIVFQIPIAPGTRWQELQVKAAAIEVHHEIDQLARKRATQLSETIHKSLQKPGEWARFEDYVIYFLEQVDGVETGQDLLDKADVTALIFAESDGNLAKINRDSLLEYVYQYKENDMVIIDWNSALVLEPSGQKEIPDVLEFALTHLLEMRYYDDLIDVRLSVLYDMIEARRKKFGRYPFWKLSHEANSRYIEFSEFIGRVENSLKVVGDFYLARIFRSAIRRFRVGDWQQSISRKMGILAQVSELLQGEVNTQRSLLLELVIIGLIAFEIIYALVRVH